MSFSRRDWLRGTIGSAAWAAIAAAQEHARQSIQQPNTAQFGFLDASAAADLTVITELILPSDDGPGAKEAGIVFFIDRALTTFDSDQQESYRTGFLELNRNRTKLFRESKDAASLSHEQQIELLQSFEKSDFFELIRTHTVLGFLGNPSYGGNRGMVGWKYIGFENRMSWRPPFGYYDAEVK
ncbi:MAG: gluconate 2-dehydrogenase subunit 3 family protein [Acidobacteriaceae bacterium]|nr:gluconate 2-dehydrogenase subunit 3 family protein [Acidobacteriaceae bacterium]